MLLYISNEHSICHICRSLITNAYNATSGTYSWDSGSTAWMLTSSALVLFMTIPGLILFYVGMVRTKNVIATCMQVGLAWLSL